jgi:PTS system nitrogen regulatory IIA component
MKLTDILSEKNIVAGLGGLTKKDVIEELCDVLIESQLGLDKNQLLEVLVERERLGSTGIGDGIAIPHGKMPGIEELLLAFGRSEKGVDFDSLDGKPAHLFFLVVAPERSAGVHLKALARISRFLKSHSVRRDLLAAGDAGQIFSLIEAQDEEF